MNIQDEIMINGGERFLKPTHTPLHIVEVEDFESVVNSLPSNDITLVTLEHQIKGDSLGYVRQGLALKFIKENYLYRRKYSKFSDYCRSVFKKSAGYCNQLIKSALVVVDLIKAGFKILPSNESQARPLTKLPTEETGEDSLVDKWQTVLDVTESHHKGILTAATVNRIVEGDKTPETKNVKVSAKNYDRLKKLALEAGVTVDQLIEQLLEQTTEPVDPETLQRWEDDFSQEFQDSPAPAPTPAPIPAQSTDKNFIDKIKRLASEWKFLEGSRPWIKEECARWGIPIDDEIGPIIPAT